MATEDLLSEIQKLLQNKPDLYEIAETSLNNLIQNLKLRENSLELKTIADLRDRSFFVDSYQRGYKWKPEQVQALLDDIDDFSPGNASDFYCLQPVVVKWTTLTEHTDSPYYWELIDGQQRITTIFIILCYLKKEKFFKLHYETRTESTEFLNELCSLNDTASSAPVLKTIDSHYFYEAYKTIAAWFAKKAQTPGFTERWSAKLLNHTKIIWYSIRGIPGKTSRQQSIEIFTRLNQGKIPLTDAELIKALFLQNVVKAYPVSEIALQKQLEMASQWDLIEQSLQDEDFWAFLSPHQGTNKYTRIELIFDLISQNAHNRDEPPRHHRTFLYYAALFKQVQTGVDAPLALKQLIEEQWTKVLAGFQRLNEWYRDDQMYHVIGFLISHKYKKIQQLWADAEGSKRDAFRIMLKKHIGDELQKIFEQDKQLKFEAIDYDRTNARPKLIALLTLFNIYRHEQQHTRFPFRRYHKCKWDIEHIHAQQSRELSEQDEKSSWLDEQEKVIEKVPVQYQAELRQKLTSCINAEADGVSQYQHALYAIIGDLGEHVHTLDNLCLLPLKVNRSIGNAPFFIKRQDVLAEEKTWELKDKQNFIPLASQQVFSKYFSADAKQMLKWSSSDRSAYKQALIDCFASYGARLDNVAMGANNNA